MNSHNATHSLATALLLALASNEAGADPKIWRPTEPPPLLPVADVDKEPRPAEKELPAPRPAPAAPQEIHVVPPTKLVLNEPAYSAAPNCRVIQLWSGHDCEEKVLGYLSEYEQPPLGFTVAQHFQTHVNNGVAAKMTLHDFDFCGGGDKLNYRGKDRLRLVAELFSANPFPLVIERTPRQPELALNRRQAVLEELKEMNVAVAPERIVIGIPRAYPLWGVEAELIYQTLLQQTAGAGAGPSSSSYSGGASGGFTPSTGFTPGSSSGTNGGSR